MLAPPIAIYKDTYLVAAAMAKMDKSGAGDDITMGMWEVRDELRRDEGVQGITIMDMESIMREEGAETRVSSVEMSDYGSASPLPSTKSSMAGPMEGGTLGLMEELEDMNSVLVTATCSTIDMDAVVKDTVFADTTPTPPSFTITILPPGPDVLQAQHQQEAQKESCCRICQKVYQSGRGLALHISSAHSKGTNEEKSENVAVRKGVT